MVLYAFISGQASFTFTFTEMFINKWEERVCDIQWWIYNRMDMWVE